MRFLKNALRTRDQPNTHVSKGRPVEEKLCRPTNKITSFSCLILRGSRSTLFRARGSASAFAREAAVGGRIRKASLATKIIWPASEAHNASWIHSQESDRGCNSDAHFDFVFN